MTPPDTSSDLDPPPDLGPSPGSDNPPKAVEHQPAGHDSELERLQAELAEALARVAQERDRGDAAQERAKALQEQRDEARVALAGATTERDAMRHERDRAREECVAVSRRADDLALQLNELRDEREALQLRLDAEVSLREKAERDRDQAQTSLKSEVATHAGTQLALKTERAQRAQLEGQLIHLREANAELQQDLSRFKLLAGFGALGTAANLIPRK